MKNGTSLPILFCVIILGALGCVISGERAGADYTDPGEKGFLESAVGVPEKVMSAALRSGGMEVMIFGSAQEKHEFAKGRATRFGQMPFDADEFLKSGLGWTEETIHATGYRFGFSNLWNHAE